MRAWRAAVHSVPGLGTLGRAGVDVARVRSRTGVENDSRRSADIHSRMPV